VGPRATKTSYIPSHLTLEKKEPLENLHVSKGFKMLSWFRRPVLYPMSYRREARKFAYLQEASQGGEGVVCLSIFDDILKVGGTDNMIAVEDPTAYWHGQGHGDPLTSTYFYWYHVPFL